MSKDTITVNMNVYDIPIVVEQLNKLEQENKQLKEANKRLQEELKHYKDVNMSLLSTSKINYTYGIRGSSNE